MKKHILHIIIALLSTSILFYVVLDKVYEIKYEAEAQRLFDEMRAPAIKIRNNFEMNSENFEIVKDYMLTKEEGFELTKENYSEKINDKEISNAAKLIFSELECEAIKNGDDIVIFKYPHNIYQQIVYLITPEKYDERKYALCTDGFYGNWRMIDHEAGFDGPIVEDIKGYPVWLLCIAFVLLSAGMYLLIGLLPPFRKKKKVTAEE